MIYCAPTTTTTKRRLGRGFPFFSASFTVRLAAAAFFATREHSLMAGLSTDYTARALPPGTPHTEISGLSQDITVATITSILYRYTVAGVLYNRSCFCLDCFFFLSLLSFLLSFSLLPYSGLENVLLRGGARRLDPFYHFCD